MHGPAGVRPPPSRVRQLRTKGAGWDSFEKAQKATTRDLLGLRGTIATLRVTARQAVYLTAAANFAHEIRLLARPQGDRGRIGAVAVGENGL
jgi:hypothetical protein